MSKIKKLVLGLSVVVTMAIAFVIGLLGVKPTTNSQLSTSSTDATHSTIINDNKQSVTKVEKPLTYTYLPGEVIVREGDDRINYNYIPSIDSKSSASVVAYEYAFGNVMSDNMAVYLKSIEADGVDVSYVYRDTRLTNTESVTCETTFTTQIIPTGGAYKYIYVLVAPSDDSTSASLSVNLEWNLGKAAEIIVANNIDNTTTTYTIVSGQEIEEPNEPYQPSYYFDAWFLDEDFTQFATFPMKSNGQTLYARFHNVKPNTTQYIHYNNGEYTFSEDDYYENNSYYGSGYKYCSSYKITNLIIPTIYNDGVNGEAKVTGIGECCFVGNSDDGLDITTISLPSTITRVGDYAFQYCRALTSITLPSSLTSIGDTAFQECAGLTSIDLSQCTSLTSIERLAFSDCSGLTSITLPNSLTSIGDGAFELCSKLTSITIPASVISIGGSPFSDSGLTSIVVESGNSVYDSRDNCNAIIETNTNTLIAGCNNSTIPSTVTSIGNYAFFGCDELTSVSLPSSLISIDNYAFAYCSKLTGVVLPNSLTYIGSQVFRDCVALTSITIPASVTKIGYYAFAGTGLTSMTFSDTTTWYRLGNDTNWNNMTGGTSTEVTDTSANATRFKSSSGYCDYYWYKL